MLDSKTTELIAIAASVAAKCQPCLDYHLEEARKAGATDSDIRNAVNIARMVRRAADENMDEYTDARLSRPEEGGKAAGPCCCCGDE
ncbi:MAG: carboxymuconolactone decarboxylase family protein [Armatimonadota bacterium]|nr:carboxymuconolactone decarboxylase family protein [Armatimonadota bacterium]